MKRVLIAHPHVAAAGGANAVAAWALQALREEFDVSLATLTPVNCAALNRSFGTSLQPGDFQSFVAPPCYRVLIRLLRDPGALLACQLTVRLARKLDRERRFDVLLSTHNEVDFGRRGNQYVNLPGAYSRDRRPLHRCYRSFCYALGGTTSEGPRRNLFLADSENIARQIRTLYDADSTVLYPPVPGKFPCVPWEARGRGFIAVGRIALCKRWEMAVEILDVLRHAGHDLTLTLIGHRQDPAYEKHLKALALSRPWFRMLHDLSREELASQIASHRYGIHTMQDEHFGIAPAEILSAGCIPFVHNSGGPVEIVGGHPDLVFNDVAEAVDRIGAVLRDPDRERELLQYTGRRKNLFTADSFCCKLREIIRNFE